MKKSIGIIVCFQLNYIKKLNIKIFVKKNVSRCKEVNFISLKKNIISKRYTSYTNQLLSDLVYKFKWLNILKILISDINLSFNHGNTFPKNFKKIEKTVKLIKPIFSNNINFENSFKNVEFCAEDQIRALNLTLNLHFQENSFFSFQKFFLLENYENLKFYFRESTKYPFYPSILIASKDIDRIEKTLIRTQTYANFFKFRFFGIDQKLIFGILIFLFKKNFLFILCQILTIFSKINPVIIIKRHFVSKIYKKFKTQIGGKNSMLMVDLFSKVFIYQHKLYKRNQIFIETNNLKKFGKIKSNIKKHVLFFQKNLEFLKIDLVFKTNTFSNPQFYKNRVKKFEIFTFLFKIRRFSDEMELNNGFFLNIFLKNFTLDYQTNKTEKAETAKFSVQSHIFFSFYSQKFSPIFLKYFQKKKIDINRSLFYFYFHILFGFQNCFKVCFMF